MEILKYTEAHLNFKKRLRRFLAKEVTPFVDRWEEDRIVPKSVWQKMGQKGFLCMDVAPEYGGQGADFLYSVITLEELYYHALPSIFWPVHSDIIYPYIEKYALEEKKKAWLPGCITGDYILAIAMTEPDAGSDLAGMRSVAVEQDDHWVLNGSKTFISNGINADVVIVAAKTDTENNPHHMTLFIIERGMEGFERGRKAGSHLKTCPSGLFQARKRHGIGVSRRRRQANPDISLLLDTGIAFDPRRKTRGTLLRQRRNLPDSAVRIVSPAVVGTLQCVLTDFTL